MRSTIINRDQYGFRYNESWSIQISFHILKFIGTLRTGELSKRGFANMGSIFLYLNLRSHVDLDSTNTFTILLVLFIFLLNSHSSANIHFGRLNARASNQLHSTVIYRKSLTYTFAYSIRNSKKRTAF